MVNISHTAGLVPSPLAQNIVLNTPSNIIAQLNSFTNYEVILKDLSAGNVLPPTVLIASGDGTFGPKTSSYTFDFYSANILGRNSYNNSWIQTYEKSEKYSINYFDGETTFKRFSIENDSGKGLLRSLELRNGNIPFTNSNTQLTFGWASDSKINEISTLRHSIKTVHSSTNPGENAIDLYIWDVAHDVPSTLGSRQIARFNGAGNFELIGGSHIDGGLYLDISTDILKLAEQTLLAVSNKGVLYYNNNSESYRFSVNGGPFNDLLTSSTGVGAIEVESFPFGEGSWHHLPDLASNLCFCWIYPIRFYQKLKYIDVYYPDGSGHKDSTISIWGSPIIGGSLIKLFEGTGNPGEYPGRIYIIGGDGKPLDISLYDHLYIAIDPDIAGYGYCKQTMTVLPTTNPTDTLPYYAYLGSHVNNTTFTSFPTIASANASYLILIWMRLGLL